jgi:50S ribosomal protein L16 3-hydroxylase
VKVSGLRALYNQNNKQVVYINGDAYPVTDGVLTTLLCNQTSISSSDIDHLPEQELELLTELVNLGFWYLD